jgi:hypothetical protein
LRKPALKHCGSKAEKLIERGDKTVEKAAEKLSTTSGYSGEKL